MERPCFLHACLAVAFLAFLPAGCGETTTASRTAAEQTTEDTGADVNYFESFDGTQIAYRDEGSGDPVVLIHGFLNTGENWEASALRPRLLEEGYRVIRPDLRGNGHSDHPHEPAAWEGNAEVRDLSALADHLELETFDVVGYSRGSIVLAKWMTSDNRIGKGVLGGMGADFTDPGWDRRRRFADAFTGRAAPDSLTRGALEYAGSIGADRVSLGLQQDFQPVTTRAELAALDLPVLVLAGNRDTDNGSPAELADAIPGAALQLVPGEHNGTYRSDAFAREVLLFLEADH